MRGARHGAALSAPLVEQQPYTAGAFPHGFDELLEVHRLGRCSCAPSAYASLTSGASRDELSTTTGWSWSPGLP